MVALSLFLRFYSPINVQYFSSILIQPIGRALHSLNCNMGLALIPNDKNSWLDLWNLPLKTGLQWEGAQ